MNNTHRIKVVVDTQTQMAEFVNIATKIKEEVNLEDNHGHRVNAKSLLGCLYSLEFDEIFVTSDYDQLSNDFQKFLA